MNWKQYRGGQRWLVQESGAIEVEGAGVIRTGGEPLTQRRLLAQHGDAMREAGERFGVPLAWIMGMIPIEAWMNAHKDGGKVADTVSLRREKDYVSDAKTPGEVSAGLMQTLLATAQMMAKKHGLPIPTSARDLYVPRTSILLGTAYMAHQMERYKAGVGGHAFDFVHLTGAYNAGSVIYDKEHGNPYRLITYSPTRTERGIRWHNDAIAVLAELTC